MWYGGHACKGPFARKEDGARDEVVNLSVHANVQRSRITDVVALSSGTGGNGLGTGYNDRCSVKRKDQKEKVIRGRP